MPQTHRKPSTRQQGSIADYQITPRPSAARRSAANSVEALLYLGETRVDLRLELSIGKNVGPVAFDAFSYEFADVKWIDPFRHPRVDRLEKSGLSFGGRSNRSVISREPSSMI